MLETIKHASPVFCTSLVTRIANGVGALNNQNIPFITAPRIEITVQTLIQGHIVKADEHNAEKLIYFFPGYTLEIPLPNPELSLYKSRSLTFALVEAEEARRSSVSRRSSRRRATAGEGSGSQTPQPTPVMSTPLPGFFSATPYPTFTPNFQFGGMYAPRPDEAGGSGWQDPHSSDSEGMPPPVPPRHSSVDPNVLQGINNQLRGLEISTGELRTFFDNFVQVSDQRHQQYLQDREETNRKWQQDQENMQAFMSFMGFNPGP